MSRSSDAPAPRLDPGLVLYVDFDAERPGELSWLALAALQAADVVLCDGAADHVILRLLPPRCFVEAAADGEAAVARAKKLAGEGWRVVRLVAGDPASAAGEAERLAALGVRVRSLASDRAGAALLKPLPQAYSTAFNGLAG
ncbi:MAG TPA: SAM-dependent methyltransferase [Stellaceae bacterium]|nr:SAM-dependent methyltransferase [Stellaceae bacterium]